MSRGRSWPVGVIGLGHVGLATAVAFAHHRIPVVGYDVSGPIRASVSRGRPPFYERDLDRCLEQTVHRKLLRVAGSIEEVVGTCDPVLLCVPTPAARSGRVDLRPLGSALREIGRFMRNAPDSPTIVIKSTVPPGTVDGFARPLLARTSGRAEPEVGVASNPEFLAEGSMVMDALHPERIVIGTRRRKDRRILKEIYGPFRAPIAELTPPAAELVKYASNAFLSLKVTFANELARFSERIGVDVDDVLAVVGRDSRIGPKFLSAGPGYGGSCFSKDLRALLFVARRLGVRPRILSDLAASNADQSAHAADLVLAALGKERRSRPIVAVLGLSFKEDTDDARDSRAIPLVRALLRRGVTVRLHDPRGIESFRREWRAQYGEELPTRVRSYRSVLRALTGAHVAAVQVAWDEYRDWPPRWTRAMARHPVVVDLRRALAPPARRRLGTAWAGLGVGHPVPRADADTH